MSMKPPRADRPLAPTDPVAVITAMGELLPEVSVLAVDPEGRLVTWNVAARRRFRDATDLGLGRPFPIPPLARRYELPGACTIVVLPAEDLHELRPSPAGVVHFHGMTTREPALLAVFEVVKNVASSEVTVLVRGESGTGKELVARAIHAESARAQRPFVAVNCGAFSPMLLESELFGHLKGSFTGAVADRQGIFQQANGGTLFLDEVGELPLALQAKLLRVLQDHVVVPVGGTRPVTVDVRVVAATHRALREEVKAGRFREDLMYRLRVVPIFLPPLRERRRDVEILLQELLVRANQRGGRRVEGLSADVRQALLEHPWPGNVRELQNVVEYAYAVGRGPILRPTDLPPEFAEARAEQRVAGDEARRIRDALDAAEGDVGKAARALGLSRTTFWRRRKALDA